MDRLVKDLNATIKVCNAGIVQVLKRCGCNSFILLGSNILDRYKDKLNDSDKKEIVTLLQAREEARIKINQIVKGKY